MFILYAQGSSPYQSNPLSLFGQIGGPGGMFDFNPRRRSTDPAPAPADPAPTPNPTPTSSNAYFTVVEALRPTVNFIFGSERNTRRGPLR